MSKEDEIREMYMNLTAAMEIFKSALSTYIHNAEYPITNLMRDLNGKISCAEMLLDGGPRVLLRADEWGVFMPVEGNPVNMELLEKWESKEIDKEIEYHNNQLTQLLARKKQLAAKEALPLLCDANFSVKTDRVLTEFCMDHKIEYLTLTIKYFVDNFSRIDLLKTHGCGKHTLYEVVEYLDSINIDWK